MPLANHSVQGTRFVGRAKASAPVRRHVVRLGLRFVTSCTPEANDVPTPWFRCLLPTQWVSTPRSASLRSHIAAERETSDDAMTLLSVSSLGLCEPSSGRIKPYIGPCEARVALCEPYVSLAERYVGLAKRYASLARPYVGLDAP